MFKVIRKLFIVLYVFIAFLSLLTIDATLENLKVSSQIKEFMDKGVLVEDEERQLSGFYFYEVVIEKELLYPSIEFSSTNRPYSVNKGDIFVERESFLNIVPFSAEFITFYFGGHAGIIYDKYDVIETSGMNVSSANDVFIDSNKTFYESNESSVIGLRVDASEEKINKAVDFAHSVVGAPYNFSFVFNRKESFYCTDLISRSFSKEAGLNLKLDKDGIATSCNDLVISDDTYMIYYFHLDDDGNKHLYYAVNE